MQINPSEARYFDQPRGNNLPVGDDHDYVGRGVAKIFVSLFSADFVGLEHGNPGGDRGRLSPLSLRNFFATAARAVRLRNDPFDLEFRKYQQFSRNVGTANAGVPQKIILSGGTSSLPLAGFFQLANFALD